ncbi:MAG: hypothetical protein RL168_42 [Bacteroidota bacterium]
MNTLLETAIADILKELFALEGASIELQETRKEFEGDLTLVVFPFLKASRMAPDATAEAIGAQLLARLEDVASYNVVKGFLNISLSDAPVQSQFDAICSDAQWGIRPVDHSQAAAMVEYSSPNTNKPLHLGHIRNNLLGYSVAQMIQATGKPVVQVQIINDRGVHICKSMYAWQQFGNGETPETSGLKGDHLVGKYYVRFDQQLKRETEDGIAKGLSPDEAKAQAPCMLAVQKMLQDWEAGDAAVLELWNTMNQWVYAGFNATYARLGVQFDKNYYESNTYLLGKKDVEEGLANGVFYRREDGSVWIDLTADGLDEKLVLRKDGTSVYMTQDIGTAIQRFADFHMDSLTYVVGNEQDYHFKVLFLILSKLGYNWAEKLSHLSYGMVDLPSGRMKSREGTVVDADDLLDEMEATAKRLSEELGKVDGLTSEEQSALYKTLGHGALKYFILKVDPKKRMVFNPEESIDFNGNTGPFLQYTHARIQSILRKAGQGGSWDWSTVTLETKEREVIKLLAKFPGVIEHAAADQNPSAVASFLYEVAKTYNGFYQAHSVLNAETPQKAAFRVELSRQVAGVLKRGLSLLGIAAPEQM